MKRVTLFAITTVILALPAVANAKTVRHPAFRMMPITEYKADST